MMEERNNSLIGALVLIISDIALIDAVYIIIGMNHHDAATGIAFFPWALCAVLACVCYRMFLRRERTLPQAVVFLGLFYLMTTAVLLIFFIRPPNPVFFVLVLLFLSVPFFRIYFMAEMPPTLANFIARFGAITFVLLFMLIFVVGTDRSFTLVLPCLITMILCLVALIANRTMGSGADSGRGVRGVAVILFFLTLIVAIVVLFWIFAAAAFGATVVAGITALWDGIRTVGNILLAVLLWVFSWIPALDGSGASPGEPIHSANGTDGFGTIQMLGETALLVILCLAAVLCLALVIFIVTYFRRKKLGGKRNQKAVRLKTFKLQMHITFTKRFVNAIKFFVSSIMYRNTPQGVFLRLERWGKFRRRGRTPGETPRHYIKRISDEVPEHKEALLKLADALDACWYGSLSSSEMSIKELAAIRRAFI